MFLYIILVLFCGFGMFGFWVLVWCADVPALGDGGGPTFAPGYRITVNCCLLVDLLFTI